MTTTDSERKLKKLLEAIDDKNREIRNSATDIVIAVQKFINNHREELHTINLIKTALLQMPYMDHEDADEIFMSLSSKNPTVDGVIPWDDETGTIIEFSLIDEDEDAYDPVVTISIQHVNYSGEILANIKFEYDEKHYLGIKVYTHSSIVTKNVYWPDIQTERFTLDQSKEIRDYYTKKTLKLVAELEEIFSNTIASELESALDWYV